MKAYRATPVALLCLCTLLVGCTQQRGGWLLMHPSVVQQNGHYVVNPRLPMYHWHQAEAFDTAAACEKALHFWITEQDSAERTFQQKGKSASEAEAWAHSLSLGRCVPSEAVYSPQRQSPRKTSW